MQLGPGMANFRRAIIPLSVPGCSLAVPGLPVGHKRGFKTFSHHAIGCSVHRRRAGLQCSAMESSWNAVLGNSGSGSANGSRNGVTAGVAAATNDTASNMGPSGEPWGANDFASGETTSTWDDSSSAWPSNPDWGETVNVGDWGELGSLGKAGFSTPGANLQYQTTPTNPNTSGYAATDPAAAGTSSNSYNGFSSSRSSSYSSGPAAAGQDPYVPYSSSTAAGAYNTASSSMNTAGFEGSGFSSTDPAGPASFAYGSSSSGQQQGGSWPFADASASSRHHHQQQQQQQGFAGAGAGGVPPLYMPSDITLIGRRDADSMLPVAPSTDQARYYQPRSLSERVIQVLGSFGVSVVLSKSAVLAGPALLYPIWGPWIRAGLRNMQFYLRQFKCVGLWRAEVLAVQLNTVPYAYRQSGAVGDTVTITVGDPWQGGARTELTFPYQPGCEDIVEGEPAELLVLCQDDSFMNFKVVREVYLPQSGMWLSEYPFVDRDVFLDVSLAIERGRQAAAGTGPDAAAMPGQGFVDIGGLGGFGAAGFTAGPSPGVYETVAADSTTAAGAGFGAGGYADWVVPGTTTTSSSSGSGSSGMADSGATGGRAGAGAAAANPGVLYNNGSAAEGSAGGSSSSSSSAYGATWVGSSDRNNTSASNATAPSSSNGYTSSTSYSSSSSSFLGNPVGAAGGLVDEFAGVASQVTGVASNVASDVASGVAAGVAAGLGWLSTSTAPGGSSSSSSSSDSSSSDNAVLPDVIIDNQGVWSPVAGYGYGNTSSAFGRGAAAPGSSWAPGQQINSQYGQPFVDQGFTGMYQRDAAGYGSSRYAGTNFYQPGYAGGVGNGFAGAGAGAGSTGAPFGSAYGAYTSSETAARAAAAGFGPSSYVNRAAGFSTNGFGMPTPGAAYQQQDWHSNSNRPAGAWTAPADAQPASAAAGGMADATSPQTADAASRAADGFSSR